MEIVQIAIAQIVIKTTINCGVISQLKMVEKFSVVWLALTYNCNNKCAWCYSSSNKQNLRESLSQTKITPIMTFLKELGIKRTILIGGEPSIYPYLISLLDEHQKQKIPTGMVTNGRKFSNKSFTRKVKENGLENITVSIEGYNSFTHDSITQISGSYLQAIKGIRNASEAGMIVNINNVITKNNFGDLEKFVDSFVEEPINGISFNVCGPCLSNKQNNVFLLNPYKAAKAFEKIYSYVISKGKKARLVTPIPICFFEKDFREKQKTNKNISGGPCQLAHGKNFVVEPTGKVIPCTHFVGFSLLDLFEEGKIITKNKFLEKYNDPNGVAYKFRQKMRRNASIKCDEPNCYEPCSGGCPLMWYTFDPAKEIKGLSSIK